MTCKRWHILFVTALAVGACTIQGQTVPHWSSYKIADGLAEPAFNSVSVTPQGKVIATTLKAPLAAALDGYSVTNFAVPAGNLGRIGESPGGQCWAMVPQGLMELRSGEWLLRPVPEIAAAIKANASTHGLPPPFLPVRQGCVLFLLSQGLMEFSEENPDAPVTRVVLPAAKTSAGVFEGMGLMPEGALWICGAKGLVKLTGPLRNLGPNPVWHEFQPPDALHLENFRQPESREDGGVTLLAEQTGQQGERVASFDGHDWTVHPAGAQNFFYAWNGPDQSLWAATAAALYQWSPAGTNWMENEEITPGQIGDVAVEPNGTFWLATADGLYRCGLPLWAKPNPLLNADAAVTSLALDEAGELYFIIGTELHSRQNNSSRIFPLPPALQHLAEAESVFCLPNKSLLMGAGDLWFDLKPATGEFHPLPLSGQPTAMKPLGILPDGRVCLFREGPSAVWETYDGQSIQPLVNPPPAQPGETFDTLFSARNGDLWLGGSHSVWWRHHDTWQHFSSKDETTPDAVVGFAEMAEGKICCATTDKLWVFDGENWLLSPSHFNHINAITQTHPGDLWLASNSGLFRFCSGVWLEQGVAEGLPNGAVHGICGNDRGQIWAATAHGLFAFHPEADLDPPRTNLRRLAGDDRPMKEGETLNLMFEGRDKWKQTPAERLLYAYQLDQQGWSVFRELNAFSLPNPAAGRHYFQVRTMDRNGNVDATPATLNFTVLTPWFRETRLWVVLILGAATALFFAAMAWQRHRQLIRSYAVVEQQVAERTRQLEIATRELLHSQKMNALGTLAAGIAHDFNNILSIIKGSAQVIEDNPGHAEKIHTRLGRIKTVVQQGAEIVEAMLGFSRSTEGPVTKCDLNAVVTDTVKLLGDQFVREIEVKFDAAKDLPELAVSREFVQQILINFIFNAAEAMSGRKKIGLATRAAIRPPEDLFLAPAPGASFVLISVQDHGGGIAPEIKARIFEPFFTTKALSTRRGTGLGLSMVYELAKKMGAGLAVHSVVGEGSVFTLIIPVLPDLVAKPHPETSLTPLPK